MSESTKNLGLPYILASQAQKHVTHNKALRLLDRFVQLSASDRAAIQPPPVVENGVRVTAASGATDDFTGRDGQLAVRADGSWIFLSPRRGWRLWGEGEQALLVFDGINWNSIGSEPNPSSIGIDTVANSTNRLAVRSNASLFTTETDDHRVVINRNSPQANAILVLQTDFEAGAELGLSEGGFSRSRRAAMANY